MNLTLSEELFMLALSEEKGSIPNSLIVPLRFGMAGASLLELILTGRVSINEKQRIVILDDRPYGDVVLDTLLSKIKAAQDHSRRASHWVDVLIEKPKRFHQLIGEGLVNKGILVQEEKVFSFVIPTPDTPAQNVSARYWLKLRARAVVLGEKAPDTRTIALVNLAQTSQLTDFIFTRDELKTTKKWLAQITPDDRVSQADLEAISAIDMIITAAVKAAMG